MVPQAALRTSPPRPAPTGAACTPGGFTLVELLVVITIIVVLAALLAPALDRAIYQAELVACAARLKVIASGTTAYAFDFNRFYPKRPTRGQANSIPMDLSRVQGDDRPAIKGYIPLRAFLDPFVAPVDLATSLSNWVQSGFYSYWVGTRYPNQKGMFRIGDRLTWTAGNADGARPLEFGLLATDSDVYTDQSGGTTLGGHPDALGRMRNFFCQDALPTAGGIAGSIANGQNPGVTASYWLVQNGVARGSIDMNFAGADGSVLRLNGVNTPYDDRMESVPWLGDGSGVWRTQLLRH